MNNYVFSRSLRRAQSGFTLVELIAVITISAVLAVSAVIAIGSIFTSYKLNAATAKVLADIRYAQQQARARNGWHGIRFRANPIDRYNVYSTDGSSDVDVLDPADPSRVFDIDTVDEFDGVSITGVNLGGGNKVEFNPMGAPYDDATGSPLASDGQLTLTLGGASRTIVVRKGTGRAELL